jgi:MATE family multidrug resistance protein
MDAASLLDASASEPASGSMDAASLLDASASEPASEDAPVERPREAVAATLRIAWPVFLSMCVMWLQSFVALWLLGSAGEKLSLAAFGLANVLCNITGHCLLWGMGAGLDTLASQAWGAKEYKAIGLYGQRALLILTLLVNLPVVGIWWNATPILIALHQDPAVASKVASFARIRIAGLFCQAPVCVFVKSLTAMGKTRLQLFPQLLQIVGSIGLLWLFIAKESPVSQHFDPVDGAATASTIIDGCAVVVYAAVMVCDAECRRCWGGWSKQCWAGWAGYLRIAVPAMLMCIFEWWSWDIVNFLAGLCPDPETALATNAVLGNVVSLAYILPCGLQSGTQTLVGNALGARSPAAARVAARVGLWMGVGVMLLQAAALYLLRNAWANVFDPSQPAVGQNVASLLRWVVFFCAADGVHRDLDSLRTSAASTHDGGHFSQVQLILSGVITGAGKQKTTTPVLFSCYWLLGLPLGAAAAFHWPRNGLLGLWWGMTLAVWLHLAAYICICFAHPCTRWAINWPAAVEAAAARLASPAADAAESAATATRDSDAVKLGRGSINRIATGESSAGVTPLPADQLAAAAESASVVSR